MAIAKEKIKKRIQEIEGRLGAGAIDGRNVARVYWMHDDLYDWYLPNGEVERITEAEYVARGGILITWDDTEGE